VLRFVNLVNIVYTLSSGCTIGIVHKISTVNNVYIVQIIHCYPWLLRGIISLKGGVPMPIIFKVNILGGLKERGYSTYRLRKEKIMGESTMTALRNGMVDINTLAKICNILGCQPGDIIEYVPDEK
ncbi:MAG: helix-turn-helix transcriptional regulator, partial [Clostridiales bacterium]|nr:helix-turn-helix transcriptional regulator [Clostridiales bacterium]